MKKLIALLLACLMVLSLAACGNKNDDAASDDSEQEDLSSLVETEDKKDEEPEVKEDENKEDDAAEAVYEREDDEDVYENVLGDYEALIAAAKSAATIDERFVLFAQAEAALLDSAVFVPTTTQGGAYTISRIAPHTIPYVQWGNDDDRLKGLVIIDGEEFITKEERKELLAAWNAACLGEGEYDPMGILAAKGHTFNTDYTLTFSTAPATIDWLNTSMQSDTEIAVNCVDGLVEYTNTNKMIPALAESWDISDDGTVYTFHIRPGVYWYTSEGQKYAEVTANDFVAGLRHMLDAQEGLEWLIDGIVVGGTDYYANGGSWDDVGYKAIDDYTLEVTLMQPTSYFLTMLTYSCFLPMCDSFYQSRGGVYGVEEYAEATLDTEKYTFGNADDVSSQVYCGAFLLQKLQKDSEIYIVKNPGYYKADEVTLTSIKWVYDNGENPTAFYNDACAGIYAGATLNASTGLLDMAKADGNFDKYSYVSDTTSTTYFGGLNVNRGTFALESGACASDQSEIEKISTHNALNNKNFRKAVLFAFDQETYNGVTRGADLALTNLRNMYTHPQFVSLSADTTDAEGHTFPAGTFFGDMVQYYCDKLGIGITVADACNGWYLPEKAVECLNAAIEELGDTVTWPVKIDMVYYSASDAQVAQVNATKEVIEKVLGSDRVIINLIEATTSEDYYASGYRAPDGISGNFDFFYGSGWGPDYGDPSTYLDTFLGGGSGYMTKVIGLF